MSLMDVVTVLQQMGAELRSLGDDAKEAAKSVREYAAAEKESDTTSSSLSNQRQAGTQLGAVTDLGDPRNAVEQGSRMIAAIEAAKRR